MTYHSIQLQNFRSYAERLVDFAPGVNIIVGPNGSGKTNLLEAVYMLSVGNSFRGADRDVLRRGSDWFRLDGVYGDQQRALTYRTNGIVVEKQFVFDGAKKARLTHQQRIPAVLFEPGHLRLLRGSPAGRRDYLDNLLAKLQPDFAWLKHQFERVLLQRNNVLRRRLPPRLSEDHLFVWDVKFAELAEQLVARRQALVDGFNHKVAGVYSNIAQKPSRVAVRYESAAKLAGYRETLLKLLHEHAQQDRERGFTTVGPQRDDFYVELNDAPAGSTASRGEVRSLLLAFKIIELRLLDAHAEVSPILLLDDVFSELDNERRRALAELARDHQTLITSTDADAITRHFPGEYHVLSTGNK